MKKSFDFSKIFDPDFLDMNKGPKIEIKPILEFPDIEYEKPNKKKAKAIENQEKPKVQEKHQGSKAVNSLGEIEKQDLFMQEVICKSEEAHNIKNKKLISDKKALKKAIILNEVLQSPLSKRR